VSYLVPQPLLSSELRVDEARIANGRLVLSGRVGRPNITISVGNEVIQADANGHFHTEALQPPPTCVLRVRYGTEIFSNTFKECDPRPDIGPAGLKGSDGPQGFQGPRGDMGPPGRKETPVHLGRKEVMAHRVLRDSLEVWAHQVRRGILVILVRRLQKFNDPANRKQEPSALTRSTYRDRTVSSAVA
jgi:hypothetical protein